MKTSEDYMKGYCTLKDKNGNLRTYQSYLDPITEKIRKKRSRLETKGDQE